MLVLMSEGIDAAGRIMDKYGIKSMENIQGVPQRSLPYHWEGVPAGTKSFALVMQDYDNCPDEGFSWLHWLVADIPGDVTTLAEDASRQDATLIQGTNSWSMPYGPYAEINGELTIGYGGPAPERQHLYQTKLFALDQVLGLEKGFFYNELLQKIEGHILAESVLTGSYAG
jgi:hypothetical protein